VARKKPITLEEHLARIRPLGGKARTENLSAEELAAIGRKGGLVGGKRRAETLSAARRKAIAQKAAKARWEKRNTR
jgi:hypothetical protein